MADVMQYAGGGGQAPPPYIDYSQGPYADPGVQQFLQTMLPRWNTQWEDPNMQGGYVGPGGGAVTLGGAKGLTDKALQDFTQQVQAVTGAPPTADQINQFFTSQLIPAASQGQPGGYDPIHPQDITSMVQQYVPTAFADQIQQHQQQAQTNALSKNIGTGTDLINQAMGGFTKGLTDPNNPMYQQFAGQMNNLGISPSSGAFQAGLGGTIGNEANQLQQQMMSSLGFPALGGMQGLSGQANQNLQGAAPQAQLGLTNQQNQLADFGRMQALMQAMSEGKGGSGMWGDMIGGGLMGAAAGGLKGGPWGAAAGGAAGAGGGYAKSQNTWICTVMVKHGVMTSAEVKTLHDHLYKAFWKRPFKFLGYLLFGRFLVGLAESVRTDWRVWKPNFYQDVMAEPSPVKAVSLYEEAFWNLYRVIKERLRIKNLILYHKPGVDHGA